MATYDVRFYDANPAGIFSTSIGATSVWSGPDIPDGFATVTDNEPGIQGTTLDDDSNGGETATADVTLGALTSTGSTVDAELVWTVRDTVTNDTFQIIQFQVENGGAQGNYTMSELPLVSGRSYEIQEYNSNPDVTAGAPAFSFLDYIGVPNVVTGSDAAETIDASYAGDPEGDQIDDGLGGGVGGDDNIVEGLGGNDTITAGDGADTVSGGDDDDSIAGGAGDDVLYGDVAPGAEPRLAQEFNWSDYADETDLRGGGTQDAGEISVSFSYADVQTNEEFSSELSGGFNNAVYVAPDETFSTTSAGYIFGNGASDNTTIAFDFASNSADYEDEVENVRFRISDIDGIDDGTNNFQDIVIVRAFDADNNPVTVNITEGSNHTLDPSTNTITANLTNFTPGNVEASALIEIPGPVSRIEIEYDNGGDTQQAIYVSDIQFDAVEALSPGDDVLDGGAGDDSLFGGEGADTLSGGVGADELTGGAGDDRILVAEGDTADGGDGDDYFVLQDLGEAGSGTIDIVGGEGDETSGDTLQLTSDVTVSDITFTNTDDAAGGLSGTFTMADGTAVTFSEIENIICFTTGTRILTPSGERRIESLREGDLVVTRDNGEQPIRWIGRRTVVGRGSVAPIAVRPDMFGGVGGTLLVSPQHRLLFTGYQAELLFGESEVLISAKHLLDGVQARVVECAQITYHHLMLDRHEVIYADGLATESFFAGDIGISAVAAPSREELFAVFPHLRGDLSGYGDTARMCLKAHEAQLLLPPQRKLAMAS